MKLSKDKVKCLECGREFGNERGLHGHFRTHKLSSAAYYQKHFPRYDKYDGTIIRFKDKEYYFDTDFNSKMNLAAWLGAVSKAEAQNYIKEYLIRRQALKKLIYALCQIELRSLPIPGMKRLNELFGDYYQFCRSLGFRTKFTKLYFQLPLRDIKKHKIIVDTREQLPLAFNLPIISRVLPFGDYALDDDNLTCCLRIERKSISDFCGTLSHGYDRFHREIDRVHIAGANMVIMAEGPFEDIDKIPAFLHAIGRKVPSPEHIKHNMRTLIQEYPEIQFLFVKNRAEASRVIEKLFASNCEYKETDLQYLYDTGGF